METVVRNQMRRTYQRRSADQRVADLDRRIAELKSRQAAREKKDDPVVREIPKIRERLRKFAQLALDNNRPDIANSALAFKASLDRILRSEIGATDEEENELPYGS